MPKQTFFNLPHEKQEKIIAAGKKEFSRASLYEASISNIIKDAEIPRGSFYQYFDGKEDIFFCVLNEFKNLTQNEFKKHLKATEGDLLEAFILLYEYLIQTFKCEENRKFCKNMFLNLTYKMEECFNLDCDDKFEDNEDLAEIISLIDLSKLNSSNIEGFHNIFQIVITLTINNFVNSFAKQVSIEESTKSYKAQIYLIKHGVYKQEK